MHVALSFALQVLGHVYISTCYSRCTAVDLCVPPLMETGFIFGTEL